MEKEVLDTITNLQINLPFASTTVSILLAAVFGEWVAILYRRFGMSLANRKVFSDIFWLLSVTTCIVIMVVKFSIALSLGLVGALSIVRFRAAIKEPEELVHLFLVIALGIACGAGQLQAALILLTITTTVFYIRFRFTKNKINSLSKDYATGSILNVSGPSDMHQSVPDFLNKTFGTENYSVVSINFKNTTFQATYRMSITLTEDNHYKLLNWASEQALSGLEVNFGNHTFLAP